MKYPDRLPRYRPPRSEAQRDAMKELLQQDAPMEELVTRLGYSSPQAVIAMMNKWGLAPLYGKSRVLTPARANELADRLERRANEIMSEATRFREAAQQLTNQSSLQHEEAPMHVSNDGTQQRAAGIAPGQLRT